MSDITHAGEQCPVCGEWRALRAPHDCPGLEFDEPGQSMEVTATSEAAHDAAAALQRFWSEHWMHAPRGLNELVSITAAALDRFSRGES